MTRFLEKKFGPNPGDQSKYADGWERIFGDGKSITAEKLCPCCGAVLRIDSNGNLICECEPIELEP